jgi:hypothetical protein
VAPFGRARTMGRDVSCFGWPDRGELRVIWRMNV